MCEQNVLASPYTSLPTSSSLPILQKYEINRIVDQISGKSKITNHQAKSILTETEVPKTKCSQSTSKV